MNAELFHGRQAVVLLVEDNDDDVELMCIAFRKSKLLIDLRRVSDGEECMAFLQKRGRYSDAPQPDLILLDLNMPKMGGHEVLAQIVAIPSLRHIPVVVLTTSDDPHEVLELYKLRCNSFIVKPVSFEKMIKVVQQLTNYWFNVVVLPSNSEFDNS